MEEITGNPMKFGSRIDLSTALTELKWLQKTKETLTNSDFQLVSEKYHFPIDFLKKGLSEYDYPDDYLVSKSKWYPIIFSWVTQDKNHSDHLLRLHVDYLQTYFKTFVGFVLSLYIPISLYFILWRYTKLGLIDLLLAFVLPFIFIYIELYIEFKSRIDGKKIKIEDFKRNLIIDGFGHVIDATENLVRQNVKNILYAGSIFLNKIESAPQITAIKLGMTIEEKEKKISSLNKFLMNIGLIPKKEREKEKINIPIFYVENPYLEYVERIKQLKI